MKYIYGIDLGGTSVKIGLFSKIGELLDKWSIKTNIENKGENILSDIVSTIKEYNVQKQIADEEIIGYGIGIPGAIVNNVVSKCANLGWENVDVEKEFCQLMQKQVKVRCSNDANVAAAGEFFKGGNYQNAVMITLGTGVGGGVIVNGQVIDGITGAAGEIGHFPVIFDNPKKCGCGNKGCLETVASATGIVNNAKELLALNKIPTKLSLDDLTCEKIFNYAKEGDALANEVVDTLSKYIALAANYLALTINPEVIIIGGGVALAGSFLIDKITKYFQQKAFLAVKDTAFTLAQLGVDAGIYGACYLLL